MKCRRLLRYSIVLNPYRLIATTAAKNKVTAIANKVRHISEKTLAIHRGNTR
jgi:hypothetical protein